MRSKISRPIYEKIIDALNKVNNLEPKLKFSLYIHLFEKQDINNNVDKMKIYISRYLNLPEMGSHTFEYWKSRGWNDVESYYNSRKISKKVHGGRLSPYSREFWMKKINPKTKTYYTIEEADFERNSRRPICKEYWINKGLSNDAAKIKAKEVKISNNKKGSYMQSILDKDLLRSFSHRCEEYWLLRGYTQDEAEEKVSERQKTFSIDICIEKYGEEEGTRIWKERQEKWQKTLNSKSKEELAEIDRRKSNRMTWGCLWRGENDKDGIFYVLDIGNGFYKIGLTTRKLNKRYRYSKNYKIVKIYHSKILNCFQVEQLIKKFYNNFSISREEAIEDFGWTETFKFPDIDQILIEIDEMFNDKEKTFNIFRNEFNLRYEENFIKYC